MRALLISEPGSLDGTDFGEVPTPEPGPDEILINVQAAGVNPADWKIIEMGMTNWALPKVAGLDAAGTIATLGEAVDGFSVGDRVVFHSSFARLGAYAEQAVAPAHVVSRLPERLSVEQAAAMPTAGYTAYQVIEDRFQPSAKDTVLIHAAAGGVGGFAVQLAKRRGAEVLATCSSANFDFVKKLGADHCIDYRNEDVGQRVVELTDGRGADAILNTLSPKIGAEALPMLAFQGQLACCTGLPDFTPLQPLPRGIRIYDISLGGAYGAGDRRAQSRMAEYGHALGALIADGEIDPMIEEILPFQKTMEALKRNKTGHQRGRLIIDVTS